MYATLRSRKFFFTDWMTAWIFSRSAFQMLGEAYFFIIFGVAITLKHASVQIISLETGKFLFFPGYSKRLALFKN